MKDPGRGRDAGCPTPPIRIRLTAPCPVTPGHCRIAASIQTGAGRIDRAVTLAGVHYRGARAPG